MFDFSILGSKVWTFSPTEKLGEKTNAQVVRKDIGQEMRMDNSPWRKSCASGQPDMRTD